ncbi:outer membrane lipoprotein-sorting protein [Ideonella livida]|uniref:Outer membrane lipoprotein-sorting protein n=1 Tax=Ideonella livida TaxID=2707176 RepID=A0A7C9TKB7_9BURK|nr:outer membrane lipoprotein-sorting protein [Ideonella livida]NDY90226.1 outer membrane lipoprotein-sorting protein [Ideonella livida]
MSLHHAMPRLVGTLALAGACVAAPIAQAAPDATTLVRHADDYRTGQTHLQVETRVTTVGRDGQADKERLYTVFVTDQRRALVLMKSPADAGQKVLMLADDFWLLMPGSQRPMRITASQKLLGDASTGDIATMSWSEDYAATLVGEETCLPDAEAGANPRRCLHLSLQANRKGVSYARIELWVGLQRHEPVRADLYVHSDKLAKQARFTLDKAGKQVEEMQLQDQLSHHKLTRIQYLARHARQVPDTWLNPMFLARNPSLE